MDKISKQKHYWEMSDRQRNNIIQANKRYSQKNAEMTITVTPEFGARIRSSAAREGMSVNAWIIDKIRKRIESE